MARARTSVKGREGDEHSQSLSQCYSHMGLTDAATPATCLGSRWDRLSTGHDAQLYKLAPAHPSSITNARNSMCDNPCVSSSSIPALLFLQAICTRRDGGQAVILPRSVSAVCRTVQNAILPRLQTPDGHGFVSRQCSSAGASTAWYPECRQGNMLWPHSHATGPTSSPTSSTLLRPNLNVSRLDRSRPMPCGAGCRQIRLLISLI